MQCGIQPLQWFSNELLGIVSLEKEYVISAKAMLPEPSLNPLSTQKNMQSNQALMCQETTMTEEGAV